VRARKLTRPAARRGAAGAAGPDAGSLGRTGAGAGATRGPPGRAMGGRECWPGVAGS